MFELDEAEEMHLPEGGDLRDFLIELEDTDESSKITGAMKAPLAGSH